METRRGLGLEAARGPRLNLETPKKNADFPQEDDFFVFQLVGKRKAFLFLLPKTKSVSDSA